MNEPNFGMALIESIVAIFILFYIVNAVNRLLSEDYQISIEKYKKSAFRSCLLIFGIILGIRYIIEILEFYIPSVRIWNNNLLFFAIMINLFYPLQKFFLKKSSKSGSLNQKELLTQKFKKIFKVIMGSTWIVALIFLLIDLLHIQLIWEQYPFPPKYDLFYLGIIYAFFTILFDSLLTYLFSITRSIENRIPKEVLKKSITTAIIIAFTFWFIQLFVFEIFLNRVFGFNLIIQDIRVLIFIVTTVYIIFFYNLLNVKFLPEAVKNSEELNINIPTEKFAKHSLESVSFKLLLFLSNKINKSHLRVRENKYRKEKIYQLSKKFSSSVIKIIVGLLWIIILIIVLINISKVLTNLNPILNVFVLSIQWSFFIVLIDISLIFLFNKIIPIEMRISKKLLQNSIFIGGIISIGIWFITLFIIYSCLFIWITEIIILNFIQITISSIIILVLKIGIIKWLAKVKNWDISFVKTFIISLVSLIIDIAIVILINPIYLLPLRNSDFLLFLFITIIFVTSFIVVILIMILFKKKFSETLIFFMSIQILLLLFTYIIENVIGFFRGVITAYHFNIQDIRVHLIVATVTYLLSFFISLRVKFLSEVYGTIIEKSKIELQPIEEKPSQIFVEAENHIILDVQDISTYFYTEEGVVRAVENVSFKIFKGETLGLVGETGCGKSVTALSILQLIRPPGKIEKGKVIFKGENLSIKSESEMVKYRGKDITMIFQDPLNSLNPVFKIGTQIAEVYLLHMQDKLLIESSKHPDKSIYSVAREWSQQLLRDLNIPSPERIFEQYPHELSGGMRQRVQIAMALACNPKLLIADEPTTAIDVTIQNQILKLMKELRKKYDTSILFITHDLGVISKMCDRVAVMYTGYIVEYGDIHKLFKSPYHPYTKGLIASIPVIRKKKKKLDVIPGMVPNLIYPPSGCRFHPRCNYCFEPCNSKIPRSIEVEPDYFVSCHLYDPQYKNQIEKRINKGI